MRRNRFRRWLRRHGVFTGRVDRVSYFSERHDLPDLPRANEIAIAGTRDNPKWALIDCPCGRGHTVLLPLSTSKYPHWELSFDRLMNPSFSPSIDRDRDQGIRCHFWIIKGEVRWA